MNDCSSKRIFKNPVGPIITRINRRTGNCFLESVKNEKHLQDQSCSWCTLWSIEPLNYLSRVGLYSRLHLQHLYSQSIFARRQNKSNRGGKPLSGSYASSKNPYWVSWTQQGVTTSTLQCYQPVLVVYFRELASQAKSRYIPKLPLLVRGLSLSYSRLTLVRKPGSCPIACSSAR